MRNPGATSMTAGIVRLGLVGLGHWGKNYARSIAAVQGASLSWCVDQSREALANAAQEYPGVNFTEDLGRVLAAQDCDAIVVAVPPSQHAAVALKVLASGKPVLVEKPLADRLESAEMLAEEAARAEAIAMSAHVYLFHPAFEAIRARIHDPQFGTLRFMRASRMSTRMSSAVDRPDVDALWDLAPNDLAMFLAFTGCDPTRVHAAGSMHLRSDQADAVFATLEFPGSIVGELRVSWDYPLRERLVTVTGSHETIVFDDDALAKVKAYAYGRAEPECVTYAPTAPLVAQIAHFVDCVRSGRRPRLDFAFGVRIVRILEALSASFRG